MLETSHDVGRPVGLCPDKWQALALLTRAAPALGLGHRNLSVLKALMSYLPGRQIDPDGAVVFPSNRSLSERLNGMPESTLRRHLAALVRAGIVSRHDSPNRKRYARRVGGAVGIAFGFDLAPLARRIEEVTARAQAADQAREELAVLRARLAALLHLHDDPTFATEARKALRRRNNAAELQAFLAQLSALEPEEMSARNSRNERHIQKADEEDSVTQNPVDTTPEQLTRHCPSFQTYFPDTPPRWRNLTDISEKMAPMIGIETPTFRQAQKTMGERNAAITVFCMLEKLASIRNPGGYLRKLTQLAGKGLYDAGRALELSADNPENGALPVA